jgi:Fe-S-cluster containining protein
MMKEPECRRCGACCRIEGIVRLTDEDVRRMSEALSIAEDEFIADWTEIAPDRRGLVLKDAAGGACIMLTEENRCRVYAVRPEKCRTFPRGWRNRESAAYCPYCRELYGGGSDARNAG